jgi:hypothetical protein
VSERQNLIDHLIATGMAGAVATPREDNLWKYRQLAQRRREALFGLNPGDWTADQILALMARVVGVNPRLNYRSGQDTIDPELTVDALDRYAVRLAQALRGRERVMFATGHPNNLVLIYQRFAEALRAAGGTAVEAGEGDVYDADTRYGRKRLEICYEFDVAVVEDAGRPVHTHSAEPIRLALAELASRDEPLPDLVVADHGWCGGAAAAGIDAIGFADCNDPALFVGEAEGVVRVAVPLDDGLAPDDYLPLADYVLSRAAA